MRISRENVAQKLADHLHGDIDQAALVDWAEHAMMEGEFKDADNSLLSES